MDTKTCWVCKQTFDISNFYRRGLDNACKQCRLKLNNAWVKSNRAKLNPKRTKYMRVYRAKRNACRKVDILRKLLEETKQIAYEQ